MNYCSNCGYAIVDTAARTCPRCGYALNRATPPRRLAASRGRRRTKSSRVVIWALIALVVLVVVSVSGGIVYVSGLGGRFHFGGNVDDGTHLSGQMGPMAEQAGQEAVFNTVSFIT